MDSATLTRKIAADVLHHALSTRTAPEFIAVSQFGGASMRDDDARFVRSMVLSAFRHLGQIDAVITRYLEKPLSPSKAWVMCALRIGIVQLYFHDVPAHAAVNTTVEALKHTKFKALSGLSNAVLKKIAQQKPELPEATINIPGWMYARWQAHYGAEITRAMAQMASVEPPYDVYGADVKNAAPMLQLNAHTLRCNNSEALHALLGDQPHCFVQDIAASYPVSMLGNIAHKHVLDSGAAPGGKTMQLLMQGAQVTALDRSEKRMARLKENLAARGLHASCIVADALAFTPQTPPDIVLLDAPCSATGTWRKHPEVLHLLREETVQELAVVQKALLDQAWSWLRSGGLLAYSVCSLQPEEGEDQLSAFLARHADARIYSPDTTHLYMPAIQPDGTLRTHLAMMAEQGGMDGFFAVVFEKA